MYKQNCFKTVLAISVLLVLSVFFSSLLFVVRADYTTNMDARWQMDNDWTDSANSYDGTPSGDATFTDAGRINEAGTFDGANDVVQFGDNFDPNNTSWSYSFWLNTGQGSRFDFGKRSGSTSADSYGIIISFNQSAPDAHQFRIGNESLNYSYDINDNAWHHVVLVRDTGSSQLLVYVDASLVDSSSVTIGDIQNGASFRIGNGFTNDHDYSGYLDDFRIYSEALNLTNISNIYTSAPAYTPSDIVAEYNFDGDFSDSAENALDASAVGDTTFTTGINGQAATFDGTNDYLNLGSNFNPGERDMSFSFWLKTDDTSRFDIFSNAQNSSNAPVHIYMNATRSENYFRIDNNSLVYNFDWADDTWHNVVLVRDATLVDTELRAYVDGVLIASSTVTLENADYSSVTRVGTGIDLSNDFDGELDEFKIYRTALSDTEALNEYLEYDSLATGLRGFWAMDESSWNSTPGEVIDSSGQGNHGTAYSGANTIADGASSRAGDFDGTDDYVQIPFSSTIDLYSQFGISLWVNQDATSAIEQTVFSKSEDSDNIPQNYHVSIQNGKVRMTNWDGSFQTYETDNAVISAGTWTHVYVDYQESVPSSARIFINGSEVSASWVVGDGSLDIVSGAYPLSIGGTGINNPFNGSVDQARLYGRQLLESEISTLYGLGAVTITNSSCPSSVQARFQIDGIGLYQSGSFSQSFVNEGANFQWSVLMNGDVNQIFGGEVTLTKPDTSTVVVSSANGLDVDMPAQLGTYTIHARALNDSLCATASITVVPDPANGIIIPGGNSGVETVIGGTDVTSTPATGTEEIYVRDTNSNIVAKMTVDKDSGRDWGVMTVFSRDKAEFGKGNAAILHYPGGASNIPGIVGSSFTLYVPRSDGDTRVRICPGLQVSDYLDQNCDGGLTLALGITGQYTVSAVTLESKDYWEIEGVTGTGGITITDGVTDTLTRLEVSQASDHTIQFGTTNGLTATGNTITITFDSAGQNWDLSSIVLADVDLEDDGVDKTLAASAAADTWGLSINTGSDTLTFTAPTSGTDYIAAGSIIVVKVGEVADGGTNQIVNPSVVDSYEIDVANDTGAIIETGEAEIPIIDDDTVNISGYIDSFITFDIDTSDTDEDCDVAGGASPCDSHGGVSDDSGYVIDLGELTTSSVNDSGDTVTHADGISGEINSIWFDLSSNADGGVVVTVQSLYGYLAGPASAQIPSVADGSEVQITAGSGLYGMNAFSGLVKSSASGGVLIYEDCDGDTGQDYYCDLSTAATELFNTADSPIDSLRMEWEVGASPDNLDGTGTYTDELTFIATAMF